MRRTLANDSRQSGFSLLELVVVVGILTIIMGAAFELMNRSQTSFDRNQILAEAHQNADFAVTRVTELIRGAGANPEGAIAGALNGITNTETEGGAASPQVVRVRSDLDGDKAVTSRVSAEDDESAQYYILSSEDVTIKYLPDGDAENDIPGHSIVLIDNTPDEEGGPAIQGVPYVLAQHITAFSAAISGDGASVTLTIEAGPSSIIDETDPRWVTFERVMQVRLRNRS